MKPPDGSDGVARLRERERRRGKERRDEEERATQQFKTLSRAKRIGATQPASTHASYGSTLGTSQANVVPCRHQATSLRHESRHVH
jgi:hypothetical protein